MNTAFQKLMGTVKLIIVFVILTLFFYGLIVWIGDRVYDNYRYDDPKGRAVKVDQPVEFSNRVGDLKTLKNRLLFYYWFGE